MENINLLRKIAWSFHKSTGYDFDDLFQEAALAYCKGIKTFNPERGALSTHIWYCVNSQLKNYLKNENDYKTPLETIDYLKTYETQQFNILHALTKDAQDLAKSIIRTPKLYIYLTPEEAKNRLRTLYSRRGWSDDKIDKALIEMHSILQ